MAGGIPPLASFPIDVIEPLVPRVLEHFGSGALQHDLTEGFLPLREALCGIREEAGVAVSPDDVLVASGSQGVLNGIGKVLIDPAICMWWRLPHTWGRTIGIIGSAIEEEMGTVP